MGLGLGFLVVVISGAAYASVHMWVLSQNDQLALYVFVPVFFWICALWRPTLFWVLSVYLKYTGAPIQDKKISQRVLIQDQFFAKEDLRCDTVRYVKQHKYQSVNTYDMYHHLRRRSTQKRISIFQQLSTFRVQYTYEYDIHQRINSTSTLSQP